MELDFERQMFLDLHNENGLVVMSKGLGIENLLLHLVTLYSDPRTLVLVLGTTQFEEKYIIDHLAKQNTFLPKIGTEWSSKERTEQYFKGGVVFVTARILVVDLLTEKVPLDQVAGIIIFRAHRVNESGQESFILRLFRQKNKKGFINALSDNPLSFTKGYCKLDKLMRCMFVTKLHLWPRIHATVVATLDSKTKPHVIELQIKLTSNMKNLQIALLELINFCVNEFKKINSLLEMNEVTVENVIGPEFDALFKTYLDPVWNRFSAKAKRTIGDVKTLKVLLRYLIQHDCVTFYSLIKSIMQQVSNNSNISDWLFLDATEMLYKLSKARIFLGADPTNGLDMELCPKWLSLLDILEEIKEELAEKKVLLLTEDEKSYEQLKEYFLRGYFATLADVLNTNDDKTYPIPAETRLPSISQDLIENLQYSHIIENFLYLERFIIEEEIKVIIIYDPNIELVRRLEILQAKQPRFELKVYFFCYSDSVEEQFYLTSIRKEKEAFENLVHEKASLVIPRERELLLDDIPDLCVQTPANLTVNSRKAGTQQKPAEDQKVIVDMREFRSQLPSLIHKRGIHVEPVTLEIGDYILTPETCIERKSINDLIGSLNSGRLYTQAQAMLRHYTRAMLLIEFDPNKSFSFQGRYHGIENVSTKVILLIIHFPKLKLIWSPSPHFSAQLFEKLKANKAQPETEKALTVSLQSTEKYNPVLKDMLLKLPGINSRNQWSLLSKVKNFAHLTKLSEDQLFEILDNKSVAKTLWESLHCVGGSKKVKTKS